MPGIETFQPLFPEERVIAPLLEIAADLVSECHRLHSRAGEPVARAVTPWLRAMNSYYTNKIEGQHTRPADIERALRKDFDADAVLACKQRIALGHMDAEKALESQTAEPGSQPFSARLVREIHAALYGRLPEADRISDHGGKRLPGMLRETEVTVGRHLAPPSQDVPGLLAAWHDRYAKLAGVEQRLVGIACAHHRLAWVHPFVDGNGRVARLQSHLALHAMGLTNGLWSPMRGLARTQEQYYVRLAEADLPRRNDYDGRGPLSQEALVAFAKYFLDVCLDQVRFMGEQLALGSLKSRIEALVSHLQRNPWQVGSEKSVIKLDVLEPLHYVAITGPLERAKFIHMTGVGDRTGQRILTTLLDYGVLSAPTSRAPVSFAVPFKSLGFLFPNLWPEAQEK